MNLKGMTSPTPSTDSLSGATTLGSFVDSHDLGLGLDINHGCHGSSSSSSTCSSIVFPHLSISNGVLSNQHGLPHGILSPTRNGGVGGGMGNMGISIKCSLCHETYSKPKVLPCLHTFCQDCLEKAQDVMDRLVCPSCRLECPLSSQGISGLLPDYAISNLVQDAKISAIGTSSQEGFKFGDFGVIGGEMQLQRETAPFKKAIVTGCTTCKSAELPAVARCFDCSTYLCNNCVMAHQFMLCFEGHRVAGVRAVEPWKENGLGMTSDRQVSCTQHKGETLQFYCLTCAVPACPECIVTEHPKSLHETEPLQDCEQKYVKHLSQYIQDFRIKSVALHDVLKTFETASVRLQNHYSKAQNEVTEAVTFYRNLLDERKGELMKELENLYLTRQVTLSVVTQRVQETLDRLYQTVEFGERLLRHASPPQILVFKKLLETRLQALLQGVPEPSVAMNAAAAGDLEFVANYTAVQSAVRNTLGYIRTGVGSDPMVMNQKLPPPPIARPPAIAHVNGYQVNQNGINGLASSMGGNHSVGQNGSQHHDTNMLSKRTSVMSSTSGGSDRNGGPDNLYSGSAPYNQLDIIGQCSYEKWSIGSDSGYQNGNKDFSCSNRSDYSSPPSMGTNSDPVLELTSKLMTPLSFAKSPAIKRQKMIYHCKFGEFGTAESQFTEPSGVTVNANNEIIVADTNNHRIQIFDRDGRFKFQFGECGKRDGQLLYPNRVAVVRPAGDIVVTERSPTHQIQIYNQYGQFVRKFGANILQHPRGITVDNKGRIIVVECKVMRVIIFDQMGTVLHKFGCSKHLEFPNGVVVNDSQEIFISDNRAHCVKVFSYEGTFLRQIGGEGLTNYPIGVGINTNGEILVADNHNNFNLTIFTQDGQLVSALESKVKHAQCFDVALMDDCSVVLASKDYRLYIYRYIQVAPLGM